MAPTRLLLALALLLTALAPAAAQTDFRPSTTLELQDEAVSQGAIKKLNCTGAGVTCSRVGVTGTVNVPGGGGAGNFAAVTVDFGPNGQTNASTVVTGQAWVTATSVILCSLTMLATASRAEGAEDPILETLVGAIHARVVATGFTLSVAPKVGVAIGAFLFHCTGA